MNTKAPGVLTIGFKKIDKFIEEQRELGNDVRWDTEYQTLVFFRPEPKGIYNAQAGAFRVMPGQENGTWGFENRVTVNDNGCWEIDFRNVRKPKRVKPSSRV